jgi:hypothetical protein
LQKIEEGNLKEPANNSIQNISLPDLTVATLTDARLQSLSK